MWSPGSTPTKFANVLPAMNYTGPWAVVNPNGGGLIDLPRPDPGFVEWAKRTPSWWFVMRLAQLGAPPLFIRYSLGTFAKCTIASPRSMQVAMGLPVLNRTYGRRSTCKLFTINSLPLSANRWPNNCFECRG